jgi:hypothetical protein
MSMWKVLAASSILLAVIVLLTVVQNGKPGLDPSVQLMLERQQDSERAVLRATHEAVSPDMACVAGELQHQTVRTLYIQWINVRPDLLPQADRDAARADIDHAIAGCGASAPALEDQAHGLGLDLEAAVARAALVGGR